VSIISGCDRNVLTGAYGNGNRGFPDVRFGIGDKGRTAQGKSHWIAVCVGFSPYQNLAKGLIP